MLNKKETAIAQAKQELIKQAFQEWIWKDPSRRERLTKLYNEKFNSVRPREYDGSHLSLAGINPEITLRQHQLNAVARGLYGGNELLGHVVGAGKTYTMVALAQESKRLGLCQKSLIVVPNHLTEQWAAEYLQLYPSANILVATAKDFETKNRKCYNKKYLDYICVDEMGTLISPHYLTSAFPKLLEKNGLRKIRFHDLRHSCASLLLTNGVSMKQIQEWLGHSDFSTTANVYAHLDFNSKLSSADAMVAGLQGALNVLQ